MQRTNIILTSRVGAWRSVSDEILFNRLFPYTVEDRQLKDIDETFTPPSKSSIKYYTLLHFNLAQMSVYAEFKKLDDFHLLVNEIERLDYIGLAGRPGDLDDYIAFWRTNKRLGSRKEIVEASIHRKFDERDIDREYKDPLTLQKTKLGCQHLAATVVLTQESKIIVPSGKSHSSGLTVKSIFPDWTEKERIALLSRPIFEPETYGYVRFDHRDSKEYLAACWFHQRIKDGSSRMRIENLFFKNQYGIEIVTPSLRPILPWLAIFDQKICKRLIDHYPEILLEGGDSAALHLSDRKLLLEGFCLRYKRGAYTRRSFDINALQRLVTKDLSETICEQYKIHQDHEEIAELLLRSIEVGLLEDLNELVIHAAKDLTKKRYVRLAAFRAVAAICSEAQIIGLCEFLSEDSCLKKRKFLANVISVFGSKYLSSRIVMSLIRQINITEEISEDSLVDVMFSYVTTCDITELNVIVLESSKLLKQEPYIEKRHFEISQQHVWLLGFVIEACVRLIENKNQIVFDSDFLDVISLTVVSNDYGVNTPSDQVMELVQSWSELNNALFWHNVDEFRGGMIGDIEVRLIDWWKVRVFRNIWNFDVRHIEDCLEWVKTKPFQDDKLVALTLAFYIYTGEGRPRKLRLRLWKLVKGNEELESTLKTLLNPPPLSVTAKRWNREDSYWKKKQRIHEEEVSRIEAQFSKEIPLLLNNIREINLPPAGAIWNSQSYLIDKMGLLSNGNNRLSHSNWGALIERFGMDTAEAMRDGLMVFWKRFNPELRSELDAESNLIKQYVILALSGLEIAFMEIPNWPTELSEEESRLAARYLFMELNGFPIWFRVFEKSHPQITQDVFLKEIEWDLFNNPSEGSAHYVLANIFYHAPWFGPRIAEGLLTLINELDPRHENNLFHSLAIISNCALIKNEKIAECCVNKLRQTENLNLLRSLWLAVWVSVDPEPAINQLSQELAVLDEQSAELLAVKLINFLFGSSRAEGLELRENHKTVKHLKALYLLMRKYIRTIDGVNDEVGEQNGLYDAQRSRAAIYDVIVDISGKEAFDALVAISELEDTEISRKWMYARALARAGADANIPWDVSDVGEFAVNLECDPSNLRELYDLAVTRLLDMKYHYELGDTSHAKVVVKTKDENELRNYLAYELENSSNGRYSISQEDEMPNGKRTDIRFLHERVSGMVPLELKVACNDHWNGQVLFDKLQTQLCDDYLRDVDSSNGIYLLIYRGAKPSFTHPVSKEKLSFSDFVIALQDHAKSIVAKESGIDNIKVIGIDLKMRSE